MSVKSSTKRSTVVVASVAVALSLVPAVSASADTSIDGPIGLGTAAAFGVLGAATVTNTGPSIVNGDLGLSPGTAVTGFPPGLVNGTVNATNAVAAQAQSDLATAYNVAASLTPMRSGLTDLVGLTLVPGVYSGGALSLSGTLTLSGTAESVWVFQAASTLITASGSSIVITGGANACNVFWQVGSSATLGSGSAFTGTVMANESITATTAATVEGRLLAGVGELSTEAVTLDTNTITAPTGCAPDGAVIESPTITSGTPSAGTVGTPYSFAVTASGTPSPSFAVTAGSLPAGLSLDAVTGLIAGTPTAPSSTAFSITASNGGSPDDVADYALVIGAPITGSAVAAPLRSDARLAATGGSGEVGVIVGGLLIAFGLLSLVGRRGRATRVAR